MGFTIIALAVGVAVGLAAGGSLRHVTAQRFRLWGLLPAGLVLQVVPEQIDVPGAFALVVVSYVCLAAFAATNLHHVGMPIVLLGLGLNMAVIFVNQGMPVRGEAIVAAGAVERAELDRLDFGAKRHLETGDDHLTFLADIVPVPVVQEVLSFGDLILCAGTANVVFRLLRPRARRSSTLNTSSTPSTRRAAAPVEDGAHDRIGVTVDARTAGARTAEREPAINLVAPQAVSPTVVQPGQKVRRAPQRAAS